MVTSVRRERGGRREAFGAVVAGRGGWQTAAVGPLRGPRALRGGPRLAPLETSETFAILAELGAILLLFEVGLESTPREMMAVGGRAAAGGSVGGGGRVLAG